ncbi:MAG: hypothetical protein MH321_07525 [Leptospiraceae bacterium]|nr:hypothetical protein [Leptospiraceae bacterium]
MIFSCICNSVTPKKSLILPIFLLFFSCSEYLGRKPEKFDQNVLDAITAGITAQSASACGRFSVAPIRGGVGSVTGNSNGTRTGFNIFGCSDSNALSSLGFPSINIEFTGNGVKGSGELSRIVSSSDFSSVGGTKNQSIEVSFQIDRANGYLDVIGNAAVSGTDANGPKLRIRTDTIQAINSNNAISGLTGFPPSSPVGQIKTYCFDIHDEGGNPHLIGWDKACSATTDQDRRPGGYGFESFPAGASPGSRIGFVLNGVTLRTIIAGEMIAPH